MIFDFFVGAARAINGFIHPEITDTTKEQKHFLEMEINQWKVSPERKEAMSGFMYYEGFQDILYKKRMVIGKNGELVEVQNLPNRRDIDNQYAIAVDKKANYFVGKPIDFVCENDEYVAYLDEIFDMSMMRKLKNTAKKAMNGGVAWVLPYYNESGAFKFKVFPAYEIKAFWKDTEHDELDFVVRLYNTIQYKNDEKKFIERIEIYRKDGVYRYILSGGSLIPDTENGEYQSYVSINGVNYNWDRIPLIPFKYNDDEIPLIRRVKALQDAINELMSMFHNNMLEDSRNTILVIENYDGQDLGEFRQNLSQYGAVKVRSGDGQRGGVSTLNVEVNSSNYQLILQLLKDSLIENARSFNGKLLNSGTPNQMNILSMYQDIDIDTNDFENEFQSAMQNLLYFVNVHLSLIGAGDFFDEKVEVIFNRDMMMNESEIMQTLISAGVKISNKTLLSEVPWINNAEDEMEQIKNEAEENINIYQGAFDSNLAFPKDTNSNEPDNGDDE